MTSATTFELPDLLVCAPRERFHFSAAARDEGAAILALAPDAIFQRLLRDQESEAVMYAALAIVQAFVHGAAGIAAAGDPAPDGVDGADGADGDADADAIAARVSAVRDELAATIGSLLDAAPEIRKALLRQRAPLALIAGCWLDTISQPATQPAVVVNRLVAHQFQQRGAGSPQRSLHELRRRALERADVCLPDVAAGDFLRRADARPLAALHGCFYVALSRLPASFLPEVVGLHYAFGALGVDDLMCGTPPLPAEPALREALAHYLSLARLHAGDGRAARRRLLASIELVIALERENVAMLAQLADWQAGLSLDAKVAAIVERHAPYAGRQHGGVRIGGRPLSETFADPGIDLARFMHEFRDAAQVRALPQGGCRFLQAIKFGGPMFGIFDAGEAATFKAWAEAVHAGELGEVTISPNRVGDDRAGAWSAAIAGSQPTDVVLAEPAASDERELFHRLVNIERFPNTRPRARARALQGFADGEILFVHGERGIYTDASYFDYTPEALLARVERIYWDKLVDPYEPLHEIPDRDEVIFGQKRLALGSLVDGAWIHRTANLGRFERESDAMLYAIYADEMGHGDLRKNHITLVHQVLKSMAIELPHIRDAAFLEQAELPDSLYPFSVQQLCMALFPDSFYNEILGYNLAIEMFGLGEVRLHEIQKLEHYGFDTAYEDAHLTIDNVSAGHAKQSAEIIIAYLDGIDRTLGDAVVQSEWLRIWRGYASFAFFAEHSLVTSLAAGPAAGGDDALSAELVI